jgi:DNA sulfur modification protein DndC
MGRQHEKRTEELDLLKQCCKDEKDIELINDLLDLQKTKTLMLRKRGLQADIETRIEKYISETKKK